ncbi:MAG: four helix bundle protein [bacterium]|nr:four helix bundle protein [bacterium]
MQKLVSAYKLWHEYFPHFPKTSRYTIGEKIDTLFIEIIENVIIASFLSKQEKVPSIKNGLVKLDVLKFFLQVAWEIKAFDNKKYIELSEQLHEVGKMLGGWKKGLENKTLAM